MKKIACVKISIHRTDCQKAIEFFSVEETKSTYRHKYGIIRKSKIMNVDSHYLMTYKLIRVFTYCEERHIEEAFEILQAYIRKHIKEVEESIIQMKEAESKIKSINTKII